MLNEREGTYPKKSTQGGQKEEVPKIIKAQEHQHGHGEIIYNIKANIIIIIITGNMETIQIQEINQNGKTKPDLDYAGVTPLSSRDRA